MYECQRWNGWSRVWGICDILLVHLFPDSEDAPDKRVIIKVESGPGCQNMELLPSLWMIGFYLYPGVPNITAVTQEIDQNYGHFNTAFRENFEFLSLARLNHNLTLSIQPYLIGILGFGGIDPISHKTLPKIYFRRDLIKNFVWHHSQRWEQHLWLKIA